MIPPIPRRCQFLYPMLCLLAWAITRQASPACSVPVFRYGLEHWTADPYRVTVVHADELNAEAQALVKRLTDASARANLSVKDTGLAQVIPPEVLKAWEGAGSPKEPWLIVQAPATALVAGAVWSGPLNAANADSVLDSPARKAIATRLGEGESAVWILLESGDKAADDAAATLLETRLTYLGTVLELPKLDEQDIRNGLVSVPPDGLRLSFSLVRVSRSDPAEQVFAQMLLSTEPDLKETSGPIAFPVFGQGRALYALVGKGIKHETIDEAASFLIGSCSCQVKEKNPGADLLMAVDWKGLMKEQAIGLADLPPASEIVKGRPETVTIAPRAETKTAPQSVEQVDHMIPLSWSAIALGAGVLCVAAAACVVFFRKRAR